MWHTSAKWADFRGFLESICIICVIVTWLAGGKKGQLCSSVLGKKKKSTPSTADTMILGVYGRGTPLGIPDPQNLVANVLTSVGFLAWCSASLGFHFSFAQPLPKSLPPPNDQFLSVSVLCHLGLSEEKQAFSPCVPELIRISMALFRKGKEKRVLSIIIITQTMPEN